jgi:hypothetical protein
MWAMGANSPSNYAIARSLRLRASNSAYLSRTPAGAGNRKTWTWSGWVKRGDLGVQQYLFSATVVSSLTDSNCLGFRFNAGGQLAVVGGVTQWKVTTPVYRDASAWYHVILAVDTSNATGADRIKIYVNGTQVTAFSTDNAIALNNDAAVNSTIAHNHGSILPFAADYFDGLITEVNFVDGQALTPSSFGQLDPLTGVWSPKKYTGAFGTNGFYLSFTDNSALTSGSNVGLGKDMSGNTNYWNTNGVSITAGYNYDSLTDVPTLNNATTSNFCTLNPLHKVLDVGASVALRDANLRFFSDTTISQYRTWHSTIQPLSGSYYFEVTVIALGSADVGSQYLEFGTQRYFQNGNKTGGVAYGSALANTNVVGVAISPTGTWVHINGTWQGGASLAQINAGTLTNSIGAPVFPLEIIVGDRSATTDSYFHGAINFGQQPWIHPSQVPTGFKSINTFNLPEPSIKKSNRQFDVVSRTGFGASGGSVTTLQFQPDLVWEKSRNITNEHWLADSVRGPSALLYSNLSNAEVSAPTLYTSFNSNGYSIGSSDFTGSTTVVGWTWKKGATPGFDVVAATGPASGAFTISHSLGVTPAMVFVKRRSASSGWGVWHKSLASGTHYVLLESTAAQVNDSTIFTGAPTSSVINLGTAWSTIPSATYIAYIWTEIVGFSKFGSYTGNGSTDGPFVNCGFRPRYVMVKRTDSTGDWTVYDTVRDPFNASGGRLFPNLNIAESVGAAFIDTISNGFKLRDSGAALNASGGTYIYAAFAENPFKYALAR